LVRTMRWENAVFLEESSIAGMARSYRLSNEHL
jgi:hypothetical protein